MPLDILYYLPTRVFCSQTNFLFITKASHPPAALSEKESALADEKVGLEEGYEQTNMIEYERDLESVMNQG